MRNGWRDEEERTSLESEQRAGVCVHGSVPRGLVEQNSANEMLAVRGRLPRHLRPKGERRRGESAGRNPHRRHLRWSVKEEAGLTAGMAAASLSSHRWLKSMSSPGLRPEGKARGQTPAFVTLPRDVTHSSLVSSDVTPAQR